MKDNIYQGFDENQWTKMKESLDDPMTIADSGDCYGHIQAGDCMFDIYAYVDEEPLVLVECFAPHNKELDGHPQHPFGESFSYDYYPAMSISIPATEAMDNPILKKSLYRRSSKRIMNGSYPRQALTLAFGIVSR